MAATDITVLVTGETGTGKELIAREIHNRSAARQGAVRHHQLRRHPREPARDRELFGHVRGAFTGAVANKPGRFQAANKGTLFLDEIGEMPLALQVKILRALQERIVTRVGDTAPEPVDIRVIAATNRDLEAEIKRRPLPRGSLLPAERGAPAPAAAARSRRRHRGARPLPAVALRAGVRPARCAASPRAPSPPSSATPGRATSASWRTASRRRVVLADKAMLGPDDLGINPDEMPPSCPWPRRASAGSGSTSTRCSSLNGGNRTKTARDLGVDPRTIFRHLEREESGAGPDDILPPGEDTGRLP